MKVVKKIKEMQKIADQLRRKGKIIGFVPTMGYLHQGHLSLVKIAKKKSDVCVVSIFVNPLQFGPKEDYHTYPRDFKRDKKLLSDLGVDIIFYPSEKEMYPESCLTYIQVKKLSEGLCGRSRPGHFEGVATVVAKLFNIVKPHIVVFGQKDYQQARIIKKMIKDLNFDIKIIIAPTVREKDGLACSSRNIYLNEEERKEATVLYQSLMLAKKMIKEGEKNPEKILAEMEKLITTKSSGKIDYIEIVDAETLEPVKEISGKVCIALAVFFGRARLIDNILVQSG
ncbi:MAG: pantoate--beta-alanine ligase [candidate division WOR-3 bacterium]|nr:pantoate--beta-alanine ligase [candidate division WOR-3 bacterium]MDW8114549.1 pantoate--beta-alanine ligase [candidate division WOR-3 bacterium]